MFMDERRSNVWDQIRQHGLRSFEKLLPTAVFAETGQEANVQLGTSPLRLPNLAWLAIALVLHPKASFAAVLPWTLRWLMDSEGWKGSELAREHRNGLRRAKYHSADRSKHDPRGTDPTVVTEEAFAQARQRVTPGFWLSLPMTRSRPPRPLSSAPAAHRQLPPGFPPRPPRFQTERYQTQKPGLRGNPPAPQTR